MQGKLSFIFATMILTLMSIVSVAADTLETTEPTADEIELSSGMLDFKAALQSAFDKRDMERLYSLVDWTGVTEGKRQELEEVFAEIMDGEHGDALIQEIIPIDAGFIEGVRRFGVELDDQGRLVSPADEDSPPVRTNLAPEYRFSFLVERLDPETISFYAIFAGRRDDGEILLTVDVPLPPDER